MSAQGANGRSQSAVSIWACRVMLQDCCRDKAMRCSEMQCYCRLLRLECAIRIRIGWKGESSASHAPILVGGGAKNLNEAPGMARGGANQLAERSPSRYRLASLEGRTSTGGPPHLHRYSAAWKLPAAAAYYIGGWGLSARISEAGIMPSTTWSPLVNGANFCHPSK